MKVYTLKSCDTCRKATNWLKAEGIAFNNCDVRVDGLDRSMVANIIDKAGWEKALNRRGTTWRGLSDADKADTDNIKAVSLIVQHPTLLKRPVFVSGSHVIVGFDPKAQAAVRALA
ncbi:MAG: Spx/MgsR family RNA polymerase-binding regulatory protein [Rhizobiaceae bacterium]